MYGPGINCMERERNEPVFYNYFCRFRNDGGTIALYATGGFVSGTCIMGQMREDRAPMKWNKRF